MVGPEDIVAAASVLNSALGPFVEDGRWDDKAGDLDWSCRRTLDHIGNTMIGYSIRLATRATERPPSAQVGNRELSPSELLVVVRSLAAVLADVVRVAPPEARGIHPAGMADPSGFAAMACDEILVHGQDIADTFGTSLDPPGELCERVLRRLFPWAPEAVEPWQGLLWANGRTSVGDHARLPTDWFWHCEPLSSWDGTIKHRS